MAGLGVIQFFRCPISLIAARQSVSSSVLIVESALAIHSPLSLSLHDLDDVYSFVILTASMILYCDKEVMKYVNEGHALKSLSGLEGEGVDARARCMSPKNAEVCICPCLPSSLPIGRPESTPLSN